MKIVVSMEKYTWMEVIEDQIFQEKKMNSEF